MLPQRSQWPPNERRILTLDPDEKPGDPQSIGELSTLQQETAAAMRAASGSDTLDRWVRQMIAHQKGAIRFSQLLIKISSQQRLRDLAASTVVHASENIRALRSVGQPRRDPGGDLDPLDRAQPGTSKAFTKPEGAAFDAAWLTTMIAFHANGARVARAAAYHGEEGSAKTLARQMAVQQDNDAAALRRTSTPRGTFLGKRPT